MTNALIRGVSRDSDRPWPVGDRRGFQGLSVMTDPTDDRYPMHRDREDDSDRMLKSYYLFAVFSYQ